MGRSLTVWQRISWLSTAGLGLTACCHRPSSAWDQTTTITSNAPLPGVVVIVDRVTHLGVCTGTVLGSVAAGNGFASYVLTAKHCVNDPDHPGRWGVSTPRTGDYLSLIGTRVLDAVVIHASTQDLPMVEFSFSSATIDWIDDWAILRVSTPVPLSAVAAYHGDPAQTIEPGSPVTLEAYHDVAYADRYGPRLTPHEHPFAWTGVPAKLVQGGHSGAPILYDGQIIAVFSGFTSNSLGCRILCFKTWASRLQLTNISTVLAEAKKQGFRLEPSQGVFSPPPATVR